MPPYTYRKLQEWIVERRRLQRRSDDAESASRELVQTAEDLAAKLRAFASDGIVVKHLIEFALPSKKRANAAEVAAKGASAAAGSRSTRQGAAPEHTRSIGDDNTHTGNAPRSAATEHASKPKNRWRKTMKIRTM